MADRRASRAVRGSESLSQMLTRVEPRPPAWRFDTWLRRQGGKREGPKRHRSSRMAKVQPAEPQSGPRGTWRYHIAMIRGLRPAVVLLVLVHAACTPRPGPITVDGNV